MATAQGGEESQETDSEPEGKNMAGAVHSVPGTWPGLHDTHTHNGLPRLPQGGLGHPGGTTEVTGH